MATRKRKGRQVNEDVIKTEPDRRRATGNNDDEDEVEKVVKPVAAPWRPIFTSKIDARASFHRKATLKAITPPSKTNFPFLRLPAEVRNMVYRLMLLSKSPYYSGIHSNRGISIDRSGHFTSGGIDTSILFINKQVHNEAAAILYRENRVLFRIGDHRSGIPFRTDKAATSHGLRSGRQVDMTSYSGLIYRHVVLRLKKVELAINLFERGSLCQAHAARGVLAIRSALKEHRMHSLLVSLQTQYEQCFSAGISLTKDEGWTIVIKTNSHWYHRAFTHQCLKKAIHVLLQPSVAEMVKQGWLKIKLEGPITTGWKDVFQAFIELEGFDATNVVEEKDPAMVHLDDAIGKFFA